MKKYKVIWCSLRAWYDLGFYYAKSQQKAKELRDSLGKLIITWASWRSLDKDQVGTGWSYKHWRELGKKFFNTFGVPMVLVGSPMEQEIAKKICDESPDAFLNYVNGLPIKDLVALIANSDFVFGFQGGPGFIADRFEKPVVLMWAEKGVTKCPVANARRFFTNWARPESLTLERYTPLVFERDATPDNIIKIAKRYLDVRSGKVLPRQGSRQVQITA